jgi:flagellar operon protein
MDRDINSIIPVRPLPAAPSENRKANNGESKLNFENVLQGELARSQELKFSAHAEKRLKERKIILAQEDLARIDQAVRQAEAKGGRESLIIYGDLALIASLKNKTVVTALDGNSLTNHVFTNIDSAVIVR